MKKPPRRPNLAITFGVLLLSGAGLLAWLWFYMLEPMRRFADLRWGSLHSELARWEKEQEHYLRTGFAPDRMSPPERLAFYGDKHWFEWLLGRLSGKGRWYEFEGCEACQFSCLEGMANHSFDSVDEWVRWYSANSGKTQEDWIQQGFEEKGFRIGLPPSKSDAVTLLGVLGTRSSDSEDVDSKGNQSFVAPYFLRYNAFRWLRDMGVDPIEFLLGRGQLVLSEEITNGLRQFRDFLDEFPSSNRVGLLAFATPPTPYWDYFSESVPEPYPQLSMLICLALIGILALSGFFLTRRGIRALRLKSAPALAASHRPDTAADR